MHRVIQEVLEVNEWRLGEFAKLKTAQHTIDENLWYRMCIPMIYAHWEGYVVNTLRILIRHINDLMIDANRASHEIFVASFRDGYGYLSGKQSFEQRMTFTKKFLEKIDDKIHLDKRIDTKSNLKSSVLQELCMSFNFNFSNFQEFTSDLDRLVAIRNSIAHGENSYVVDRAAVIKYIAIVSSACDIILNEVLSFIENKKYLAV